MALSDLSVFSQFVYLTATEVAAQKIELFNAASANTIVLSAANNLGDYSDKVTWAKISGLVRRRNAYGSGSVASKKLTQLTETMVKAASGTHPIEVDPGMFKWIRKSPEEAGAVIGTQLAADMMQDQLNSAILCAKTALANTSSNLYDGTSDTVSTLNPSMLVAGAGKFGDASGRIRAWIMHSTCATNFYQNAIANVQNLFRYETIGVISDPFGRVFIVSDIPALLTSGAPDIYWTLGLVQGGVSVEQNGDFTDNLSTTNGDENIKSTYQAEWTNNIGIMGYKWDKTNGGPSPSDAALGTASNWDKYATSHKDLAGVIVKSK